jgi:hypothetical protein
MKLVPIDKETKELHARATRLLSRKKGRTWWYVDKLPDQAIEAVSTGGGSIKKGLTVYLIDGHNRNIYPHGTKLTIHEYVGLVKGTGWQPLVQLGRDVDMV